MHPETTLYVVFHQQNPTRMKQTQNHNYDYRHGIQVIGSTPGTNNCYFLIRVNQWVIKPTCEDGVGTSTDLELQLSPQIHTVKRKKILILVSEPGPPAWTTALIEAQVLKLLLILEGKMKIEGYSLHTVHLSNGSLHCSDAALAAHANLKDHSLDTECHDRLR